MTLQKVAYERTDLKDSNSKWWREQIGLVRRQPVIFEGMIESNIRDYGLPGATEEEIVLAAKLANAHDFIMKLPDGY